VLHDHLWLLWCVLQEEVQLREQDFGNFQVGGSSMHACAATTDAKALATVNDVSWQQQHGQQQQQLSLATGRCSMSSCLA
jgi:hypothetical protein